MKRIAKFHKVSKERFVADWMDAFEGVSEEDSEEWETEDEESEEPDADGGSTEEDDEDSVK